MRLLFLSAEVIKEGPADGFIYGDLDCVRKYRAGA